MNAIRRLAPILSLAAAFAAHPAAAQDAPAGKEDEIDRLLDEAAKQEEPKPGEVGSGDKDIDSLLEKLGQESDTPETKAERGNAPMPPDGQKGEGGEAGPKPDGLEEKSREIDQHLEEMIRTKRKKQSGDGDGEAGGAMGEMIKQMREVQKRLEGGDTGKETQKQQEEIIKKLTQALEQAKQQGQSGRGKSRQMAGNQQQGQENKTDDPQEGVGPQKPQEPKRNNMVAKEKDEWGHLPPDLRQEMNNVFKEKMLEARKALIEKYYLSVARKGRAVVN